MNTPQGGNRQALALACVWGGLAAGLGLALAWDLGWLSSWRALGAPPEPAVQITGVLLQWPWSEPVVVVRGASGQAHSCCQPGWVTGTPPTSLPAEFVQTDEWQIACGYTPSGLLTIFPDKLPAPASQCLAFGWTSDLAESDWTHVALAEDGEVLVLRHTRSLSGRLLRVALGLLLGVLAAALVGRGLSRPRGLRQSMRLALAAAGLLGGCGLGLWLAEGWGQGTFARWEPLGGGGEPPGGLLRLQAVLGDWQRRALVVTAQAADGRAYTCCASGQASWSVTDLVPSAEGAPVETCGSWRGLVRQPFLRRLPGPALDCLKFQWSWEYVTDDSYVLLTQTGHVFTLRHSANLLFGLLLTAGGALLGLAIGVWGGGRVASKSA